MLDFFEISTVFKKDEIEVSPEFILNTETDDLMIKGGDFYAVWDGKAGLWSKSEGCVIRQVDEELWKAAKDLTEKYPTYKIKVMTMKKARTGSIDRWHKFCQKQMRDKFISLDEKLTFANTDVKKTDYASKRLPYPLQEAPIPAYEELISTLYDEDERQKIEWAIGSIISGDSKHIEKFEVLYGDAGSGKGTVLKIISWLFEGYTSTFRAKELASASNAFALESFKDNPLVSIQYDGNLSRIEDNTKLNSIVSHEPMEVNAKYTKIYTSKFIAFLFMGTNNPVKITEAKSGILRRLIDVKPSGRKVGYSKYQQLISQVKFELGGIAWHCLKVYEGMGEDYYNLYVPTEMMAATNDFYGFMEYNFDRFKAQDHVTLSEAWGLYKEYCEFAHANQIPLRAMRVEFANYFRKYEESAVLDDVPVRSLFSGFRSEKFDNGNIAKEKVAEEPSWLDFKEQPSAFDIRYANCQAQYSKTDGSPESGWDGVETKLSDIDTHKLHWVRLPAYHVSMDFDIPGNDGKKNFEANKKAAEKFPPTYAELSKSGCGIHLEYYYEGDASRLRRIFGDHIEIKTYTGKESLRRKLTLCNNMAISVLREGSLPLKGDDKKVVDWDGLKSEKQLRTMIMNNINKKYHADTASSIDYIKKLLDDAYDSGMKYDVSDMQPLIFGFAMHSTNQRENCVSDVSKMKFKSEVSDEVAMTSTEDTRYADDRIVFIDCEVYKNFFGIVWKFIDADECVHMIQPEPHEVEFLYRYKLAGYNSDGYDCHMLWARAMGKTNKELYDISQQIISNKFRGWYEAKKTFYTDVLSFCTEKQSLKKFEIQLGIPHKEMDIPWDQPVPEDRWEDVMKYCENDVRATEAVFKARQADFRARQFQVDLCKLLHGDGIGVNLNTSTNDLSKRIIFGTNRKPQNEFNWRDMSQPVGSDRYDEYRIKFGKDYKFRVFDSSGLPQYRDYVPGEVLPEGWSILPFFPGYKCVFDSSAGKYVSTYLGEIIGEGGRVFSRKGFWPWVWDGDISSQHPHSMKAEVVLGPRYQPILNDIVAARVAVKHHDFETAGSLLKGALKPYLNEEMAGDLAYALKIIINSIYGLTKASFVNEFRDPRNFDNIVAKRGALFMTLLKQEVEKRGYTVCHIKTDSIKIPDADDAIKEFVIKFGKEYGYDFETEGVFVKFALFNDAAYVAKTEDGEYITKADQFKKEKQPYLFKTLFSHEPYEFKDFCEVKSVSKGAIYLDMNEDLGEPVDDLYDKENAKLNRMLKKAEKKLCEENPGISDAWLHTKLYSYDTCEFPEIKAQFDICEKLKEEIPKHHKMVFVGRVGQFTPVVSGAGGGVLYRVENGQKYAISGSTGYRWLESEDVKQYGMEEKIDKTYYMKLVDEAIVDFNEIVDFDWFVSDELPTKKEKEN